MQYTWRFNKRRRSEKAREPVQSEFFATDAIDNWGEALVREGIQNSLDARKQEELVQVRIHMATAHSSDVSAYFTGIAPHLQAQIGRAHV